MSIDNKIIWQESGTKLKSKCPVCENTSDKIHMLNMDNPLVPEEVLEFVKCRKCGSGYVHDFVYPDYELTITRGHLRFYIEQGAGIDILARPAYLASKHGVKNYLEIGCGYGFGVDFAEKAMGLNSKGIDPSTQSMIGSKDLGVNITSEYLTSESAATQGKQDMIVAMEVIEHITDPQPFLKMIIDNLTPSGIVVMSTPNVAALDDRNSPMLVPILTPGFHAILFSANALKKAFKKAGFRYAKVIEGPDSLFVVASVDGKKINPKISVDPEIFIKYTSKRMDQLTDNNNVWSGFAYRNFKTLINAGLYEKADEALEILARQYDKRFDVDILDPNYTTARFVIGHDVRNNYANRSEWTNNLPFHLCNLFYFIGILKLNTGKIEAVDYFYASVKISEAMLKFYDDGGYGDGETAALHKLALSLLARCANEKSQTLS